MAKVKIKQFKNKAKEPVAGLTPEHAIYDKNGVRLDAKLGNVNLQEFRDLQQQCVNNIKQQQDTTETYIDNKVVSAKAEIDTKYKEVSQLTQASMIGANTGGLEGSNVQDNLNDAGERLSKLESQVIYDVTVRNNGIVFESLSALLHHANISTIIPPSDRIGGMIIRFLQSPDNKYVQYRLMTTTWSFNINDWQGVDDEPIFESDNMIKSGGVFPTFNAMNKALLPINGKVSIIGDSSSAFKGTLPSGYAHYYPLHNVTSLCDMWWHMILSLTNSKLEVNASWYGSMVTNGRSGEGIPDFYDRTSILGSPDYIFVALGTNDSQRRVPLGDYDYDSENLSESEFIPAYIKGVKALKMNYPTAKIVLFIFAMNDVFGYSESIKNIGKHYGLDVIDVRSYYDGSNLHPANKKQMSIVAQTISTFYTSNASQLEFNMTEFSIGGTKTWSVLKPAGAGVNYFFKVSPGTQVIISLSGVSDSDTVNCVGYDKDGKNLGSILVAKKADTEINYLATNGLSGFRVVNNNNSAVTLSIRKAILEEELNQKIEEVEEELKAIKLGSSKIMSNITIPQRESSGGTDFPLLNTLKKGIPYKLTKTCSDFSKYNNFRFKKNGSTYVNFYIDNTYITGYAIVSDGVHTLILDDDATIIRSTDNTKTSIEIEIEENIIGLQQINVDIQNELYPLSEAKPLYDYTVKNQGLCIDDYISSIEAYRLIASYNGFNFLDQLNSNKVANIRYENTEHDSQIVVKENIAYVVYASNIVTGDNASSPTSKVILTKFNIDDFAGTRVDLEVAKSGSNQQTGGAGQPNIIADEIDADLLHIIYTCNSNNGYTIFTCDYSVSNGTCSNYREVVVSNKDGETGNLRTGDINRLFNKKFSGDDTTYHSQQCNSTIAYSSGYYYIGMVVHENYLQDKNLAVIFKTQDFTNWDYFADYESFNEPCVCELAIGVDSNGNIYSASRPINIYGQNMGQYGASYGTIAKWDANGVLKDRRYYRNCGTRPSFFNYNSDLYLISNTWYRSICDIIKVNTEQLCASQLLAQFKKGAFCYTSFALYGDYVIVSSSAALIEVSKITWPVSISENDAYTKLKTIIM